MSEEKFDYFISRTEKDLDHIKKRVDDLWDFRTGIIGGSIIISVIVSALISALSIYFKV